MPTPGGGYPGSVGPTAGNLAQFASRTLGHQGHEQKFDKLAIFQAPVVIETVLFCYRRTGYGYRATSPYELQFQRMNRVHLCASLSGGGHPLVYPRVSRNATVRWKPIGAQQHCFFRHF